MLFLKEPPLTESRLHWKKEKSSLQSSFQQQGFTVEQQPFSSLHSQR